MHMWCGNCGDDGGGGSSDGNPVVVRSAPANAGERRLLFGCSEIYFAAKSACLPQRRPGNCASAGNASNWMLFPVSVISPVITTP